MSHFSQVAAQVQAAVQSRLGAAVDMDAERQRVNSYIADVLKDSHVLYAKLARLQGDFKGKEAEDLFQIGQKVLALGDELSRFAKAFREGEAQMADTTFAYGDEGGAPQPAPEPAPEPEPEGEGVPFGEAPEEEGEEETEEEETEEEEAPAE
jgi:hypothetical protein